MQSREQIFQLLSKILVNEFDLDADRLGPDSELEDDLDLDSIDAIDLVVQLEVATGIQIADDDRKALRTLADVVDLVHGGLGSPAP